MGAKANRGDGVQVRYEGVCVLCSWQLATGARGKMLRRMMVGEDQEGKAGVEVGYPGILGSWDREQGVR